MKFSKGQRKRIKCEVCQSVKNATLIHAKKSFRKTASGGEITIYGEKDTFILQYKIGKHQRGKGTCKGSDKIQSREYDGLIDRGF